MLTGINDERDGAATIGSGRFRRKPRSPLSRLAPSLGQAEEALVTDGFSLVRPPYLSRLDDQDEAERTAEERNAREWREDFKAKADPKLLEWLRVVDGHWESEPLPWQWWEARLDGAGPELRDWLVRMSDASQEGPTPGP